MNGVNVPCVVLPLRVIRKLLLDESRNELLFEDCEFCRVSRDVLVPVMADMFVPAGCVAVSGAVGVVNAPV